MEIHTYGYAGGLGHNASVVFKVALYLHAGAFRKALLYAKR
jgi:hypothetical protein